MLDLYLIRHAQTERNAQGRYPAAGEDPALSADGETQAGRLPLIPGDLWSSPARRCLQTAALASYPAPRVESALLEADFGVMAGHTWAELEAEYGDAPRLWTEGLADPTSAAGPPGGESGEQFHDRIQRWLGELPDTGSVVAFSHAGVILAALRLCLNLSAASVQHAKVTHLRRSGGTWWIERLNG
ncbi:histidine phosphatase family protein [Deinococcus sp.]|uniref:histidine phosphatase family protein n=1 Tax=Deinococcus sp. TaxID=47478 RepID=UPI0025F4CE07|nr:histidine phosphatase family protein [Deinococcus sp.]